MTQFKTFQKMSVIALALLTLTLFSTLPAAAASGSWTPLLEYDDLEVSGLTVSDEGYIYVTGTLEYAPSETSILTIRSTDGGSSWLPLDQYPIPDDPRTGVQASGAHDLYVGADGTVYVLAWHRKKNVQTPVLRKSSTPEDPNSWVTTLVDWVAQPNLGAITGDDAGNVYVVLGFATMSGELGWEVRSSLNADGPWKIEDLFVTNETQVFSVHPYDLALVDGTAVVSGQLQGMPDRWVVRRGDLGTGNWVTDDLFVYTPTSYGLSASSVALARNDSNESVEILVAGFGVPGGSDNDYRWIVRQHTVHDSGMVEEWDNQAFRLSQDKSSFAVDATYNPQGGGFMVAGLAETAGTPVVLLWQNPLQNRGEPTTLSGTGINDAESVRLAIAADGTHYVAGYTGSSTMILEVNP